MISDKTASLVLRLAGIYNLLWGAWVVIFPAHFFVLAGLSPPDDLTIWQGVGMIVGVYGLGYWLAAAAPLRHWIIVAVGFLGKLFGPIGFVFNYLRGEVEAGFGYMLLTNDLIWWIPFALILWRVHRETNWQLQDDNPRN